MKLNERPANRLDRALWRLERTLKEAAEHPMRRLRTAIAQQRKAGAFDEDRIIEEILTIEARAYVTAEDVDHLAAKLETSPP